ncbi:hypothetical protein [Mesorhizobium tianshanense]|uniref:hypothetical protein n=1 Tax=Mesorhizobium tianshanense TaxID=39844 RepID=UPI0011A883FF|nr:hypothetical protein [Mesorhizobium tianshanense]
MNETKQQASLLPTAAPHVRLVRGSEYLVNSFSRLRLYINSRTNAPELLQKVYRQKKLLHGGNLRFKNKFFLKFPATAILLVHKLSLAWRPVRYHRGVSLAYCGGFDAGPASPEPRTPR